MMLYVGVLEAEEKVSVNILLKTKCSRIEYRNVLFTVNTKCIFLLDLCLDHEIQAGIQSWH